MLARGAFLARRMGAVRLLLASVLVSTLAAASLVAALTGFAVRSLPQAVGGNLARSPGTSVAIYGEFGDVQAGKDQRAVPAAVRAAFGAIPFTQHEALWSDSIGVATRGRTMTVVLAAALTGIAKHARLTAGAWPAAVAERGHAARGTVIQAAVPATVASALHVQLGQLLVLRDRLTGALVRFRLTGLYRPRRPTAPYWGVDLIAPSGISVQPGFVSYGPLDR